MKTIILYATKYGAAREIAKRIASRLPGASVCDLKKDAMPPIAQFDCVIIGGPLYAGMLRKEAKDFAAQNAAALSGKTLGLFLSGMDTKDESVLLSFKNNFPEAVLNGAKAKSHLGGIFDPAKAGALEKLIFKAVAKQSGYVDNILDEKIDEFVETLKA